MSECAAEDPAIVVTITWGEESELVIGPTCEGESGIWWNSLSWPDFDYRYAYAPPSQWVPGNVLLAAVLDSSIIPMSVGVRGTDVADVEAQKELVRVALAQMHTTVTITFGEDTVGTYAGLPTAPQWGKITPQIAGMLAAEGVFGIPVNPAGAP